MKLTTLLSCLFLLFCSSLLAQSASYQKEKARKIEEGSPFTKIINRELPATIVFEDEDIIAFVPLKEQAKVKALVISSWPTSARLMPLPMWSDVLIMTMLSMLMGV